MEAAYLSETSLSAYQITWYQNPEDHIWNITAGELQNIPTLSVNQSKAMSSCKESTEASVKQVFKSNTLAEYKDT